VKIIDLANSKPLGPVAADFAMLEVDYWNEVLARPASATSSDDSTILNFFVHARDYLDGRIANMPPNHVEAGQTLISLANHLRHRAFEELSRSPLATHYILRDYFHCLAFSYLDILRRLAPRRDSDADPTAPRPPVLPHRRLMVKLALLGASLAFEVLENPTAYTKRFGKRSRPWEVTRYGPID
jgi:hypothetical protein